MTFKEGFQQKNQGEIWHTYRMKRALITGVTGQDGSYLSEWLLNLGYEVHGLIRRTSSLDRWLIDHISNKYPNNFVLHYGDLHDDSSLTSVLKSTKPDEIYNLAAQSHVRISFDTPLGTSETVALGTLKLLENIRIFCPESKFYQASSSEMFGSSVPPQNEETRFEPRSPYAVSKVFSHMTTKNYRDGFNIYAVNGILFNHESSRRGENFVTRKIAKAAAEIKNSKRGILKLGNINSVRDWGFAPEYVIAMHKMLQMDSPSDYVIGTGSGISVEQFLTGAFEYLNLNWRDHVEIDESLFRPTEVDSLVANPKKASKELEWGANIKGEKLIELMVEAEMSRIRNKSIMVDAWKYVDIG